MTKYEEQIRGMAQQNRGSVGMQEARPQPEQEPVCDKDPQGCWNVRCQLGKKCKNTPPQRTWVGLTLDEIAAFERESLNRQALCCAIEAKLKEKNNG